MSLSPLIQFTIFSLSFSLSHLLHSVHHLILSLSPSPSSLYLIQSLTVIILIQSLITFSLSDPDLSLIQFLSFLSFVPKLYISFSPLHLSHSVPQSCSHSVPDISLSRSHSVPQSLTPLSLSFSPSVPYTSLIQSLSPALIQSLTFLSLAFIHFLGPLHLSHSAPQSLSRSVPDIFLSRSHLVPQSLTPLSFSPSVPYTSLALIQSLSPLHLSHSVPQSLTPLSLSFSP